MGPTSSSSSRTLILVLTSFSTCMRIFMRLHSRIILYELDMWLDISSETFLSHANWKVRSIYHIDKFFQVCLTSLNIINDSLVSPRRAYTFFRNLLDKWWQRKGHVPEFMNSNLRVLYALYTGKYQRLRDWLKPNLDACLKDMLENMRVAHARGLRTVSGNMVIDNKLWNLESFKLSKNYAFSINEILINNRRKKMRFNWWQTSNVPWTSTLTLGCSLQCVSSSSAMAINLFL